MHRLARVSSVLVLLIGIATVAQTFFSHYPLLLEPLAPYVLPHPTRSLSFILGIGLTYLAYQLWMRKEVAWWLSIVWLVVTIFVTHGRLHLLQQLAALGTLVILLAARQSFTVKNETTTIKRTVMVVGVILVVALAYGIIGFYLLDRRHFGVDFTLWQATTTTLREYTLIGNPGLPPRTRFADWFLDSVDLTGIVSSILILFSLFRPVRYFLHDLPSERHRAETILRHYGRSSDDFFKLWPHDKSYWFWRECFVAYKVCNGIAIALGDPSGPADECAPAVEQFSGFANHQGWRVCFLYTLPESNSMYETAGLNLLKIGEDAVINLDHFAHHTSRGKYFRYINRRFTQRGYTCAYYSPPHSPQLLHEVAMVSRAWLKLPGRQERGFALGHFAYDYIRKLPLFVVRDQSGRAVAFVNEIESFLPHRSSIDLMRFIPGSPNGVMDYLLSQCFALLQERGVNEFNLGFVPLSNESPDAEQSPEMKALSYILSGRQKLFSFAGLRAFKAKYDPTWEERFLAYQGTRLQLLPIAIAIYRALT